MSDLEDFRSLGLSEEMLAAIASKGFETPSPIQRLTIPVLLGDGGNDLIGQAQTGTGKTAAFGLPLLERLEPSREGVGALILVPTRELALQVTEELLSFNRRKLHIAAIYGGASMSEQLRRLAKGVDIVVGTPGRVLDHIRRGTLKLATVRYLVLDEADEMLNMGFIEDVEEIMSHTDEQRRVLLFSATMPARIVAMTGKYMRDVQILKVEDKQVIPDLTNQIYFEVRESDKFDALTRIIDVEADFYGIVFSRTKVGVDEMTAKLLERGYAAEGLHGDVSQAQREKILRKFKKKQINILVATDVAARGIDVNNLTHVINYSLPQDSESYVHRIGRTGRAGNEGTAITFISSSELRQFGYLKRDIKVDIRRESLPTPGDVVATKRARILDDLAEIVESGNYEDYAGMAAEILASAEAEVALSALLKLAFKNDLSENQYPEIRSINVDRKGKTRLFVSIGRLDGYDARKMAMLLKRECSLRDSDIDDIRVMDAYSFVTVPFNESEAVISKLNVLGKGERPLAGVATEPGAVSERGGEPRAPRKPRKDKMEGKIRDHARRVFPAKAAAPASRDMNGNDAFEAPAKTAKAKKAGNEGFDWSAFEAPYMEKGKAKGKKSRPAPAPTPKRGKR